MSQEQCIKALSEHAGIKPLVTLTGPIYIVLYIYMSTHILWSSLCYMLHLKKHVYMVM
jgi:hypothetical protein